MVTCWVCFALFILSTLFDNICSILFITYFLSTSFNEFYCYFILSNFVVFWYFVIYFIIKIIVLLFFLFLYYLFIIFLFIYSYVYLFMCFNVRSFTHSFMYFLSTRPVAGGYIRVRERLTIMLIWQLTDDELKCNDGNVAISQSWIENSCPFLPRWEKIRVLFFSLCNFRGLISKTMSSKVIMIGMIRIMVVMII